MRAVLVVSACAVLLSAGCAPANPVPVTLLEPGHTYRLRFRPEMQDNGYSVLEEGLVNESAQGKGEYRLVKSEETKRSSAEWAELDLSMEVKPAAAPGRAEVRLRIGRFRAGNSYRDANGIGSDTLTDQPPDPNDPSAQDSWRKSQDLMRTMRFTATINERGSLAGFDASGGPFDSMKKEMAAEGAVPEEQAEAAVRFHAYGIESALSDALAYLPPADANAGRTWEVVRARVYPCHAFGFHMMTNGCAYSTEKSTCRLHTVEQTPAGRVATIRIDGRRVPQSFDPSVCPCVDYMETTGELRFNLDTKEIVRLRVEAKPHWIDSEDRRLMDILFVSEISLRRDGE